MLLPLVGDQLSVLHPPGRRVLFILLPPEEERQKNLLLLPPQGINVSPPARGGETKNLLLLPPQGINVSPPARGGGRYVHLPPGEERNRYSSLGEDREKQSHSPRRVKAKELYFSPQEESEETSTFLPRRGEKWKIFLPGRDVKTDISSPPEEGREIDIFPLGGETQTLIFPPGRRAERLHSAQRRERQTFHLPWGDQWRNPTNTPWVGGKKSLSSLASLACLTGRRICPSNLPGGGEKTSDSSPNTSLRTSLNVSVVFLPPGDMIVFSPPTGKASERSER